MRVGWSLLVCLLALGACAPGGERAGATAESTTTSSTPLDPNPAPASAPGRSWGMAAPETEAEPAWTVGAEPLPLRADGLGQVLPTPDVLVDRRLSTTSVLAPPPTEQFESTVAPLDDTVIERMGTTWEPGCPTPLDELRHLSVSFWGFDGGHHTGELILHRDVVEDVAWVFEQLHGERFPIEEMRIIATADLEAPPTGDGNNTASFVCRKVRGGSSWSEHARGLAVDINPFHNPYQRGEVVLPELASAYLDRGRDRPGMIQPGDVVVESFAAIGWHWGGSWSSPDHMHFSATGR